MHLNINYMLQHPDFETAYRSDVEKFENTKRLNIKKNDDFRRDEEFVAVETSFKKTKALMLQKKFETLYTESLNADEADITRMNKTADKEALRAKNVRNAEPLNTKGVSETFQPKSIIKMNKGPFYKLMSKDGLVEDCFDTCPQRDLIDYANRDAPRVMIVGKPRSGKTLLAKNLAKRLDLVHVSVENWIKDLADRVKNYEPPEDVPEPPYPEWKTPLESRVWDECLAKGSGPSQEDIIEILQAQC
jgi:hypothetical protein